MIFSDESGHIDISDIFIDTDMNDKDATWKNGKSISLKEKERLLDYVGGANLEVPLVISG